MARWTIGTIAGLLLFVLAPTSGRGDEFNIGDLPGLTWWASAKSSPIYQDTNQSQSVKSGDPVGFLGDLSGQGNNGLMGSSLVSGGDAFRPTYVANVNRGQPGILFNGVNDYLDLNDPLFSGSNSFTVAFAIETHGVNMNNMRLFGAGGTGDGVTVGYSGGGPLMAQARTKDGIAGVTDQKGSSIDSSYGPENMQIVIARYQAGGTFDLWNNGQLVSSVAASPAALVSPADKIIGGQNWSSTHGVPQPQSSLYGQFYFLEGMTSKTALSNGDIQNLYSHWTQTLPGIQHQGLSPNLYWDSTQNPDRTAPVANPAGHIQGVAVGDGAYYSFHTSMIDKFDSSWHEVTHNDLMLTGISNQNGAAIHSGDGDYYKGLLFAPVEKDLGAGCDFIAVYDANKDNLPLVTFKDISAQGHEVSSLTIVPENGAHGVIYVSSYAVGSDKLWMYDLADGDTSAANFGSFLGALTLPAELKNIQGVAYHAPYFYFSENGNQVARVLYQDGVLAPNVDLIVNVRNTVQGLAFQGDTLLQVEQFGTMSEYVEPFVSSQFQVSAAPEPSTAALTLTGAAILAAKARRRARAEKSTIQKSEPASAGPR